MSDDADRAQAREEQDRDAALAARRVTPEEPFEIEGRRVCLDCFEPIPNRRLAANPDAVRCVDCQNDHEKGAKQRWNGS